MQRYSKFLAAIIGGAIGVVTTKYGLPEVGMSGPVVDTLTQLVITGIATYIAPANKPG